MKVATRAALIAAGIEELGEHGLDASLDAICARARLTRGAFYVHFADREAFIVAVMQHVLGTFVTALTSSSAPRGTAAAITRFLDAARAQAPVVRGSAGVRFHHLIEACRRSRAIGDNYRGLLAIARDQLAGVIDSDRQSGDVRTTVSPRALADLFVVTALGIVVSLELELPLDLGQLGETITQLAC